MLLLTLLRIRVFLPHMSQGKSDHLPLSLWRGLGQEMCALHCGNECQIFLTLTLRCKTGAESSSPALAPSIPSPSFSCPSHACCLCQWEGTVWSGPGGLLRCDACGGPAAYLRMWVLKDLVCLRFLPDPVVCWNKFKRLCY